MIKKGIYIASILLAIVFIIISINIARASSLGGLEAHRLNNLVNVEQKLVNESGGNKAWHRSNLGLLQFAANDGGELLQSKSAGVLSYDVL